MTWWPKTARAAARARAPSGRASNQVIWRSRGASPNRSPIALAHGRSIDLVAGGSPVGPGSPRCRDVCRRQETHEVSGFANRANARAFARGVRIPSLAWSLHGRIRLPPSDRAAPRCATLEVDASPARLRRWTTQCSTSLVTTTTTKGLEPSDSAYGPSFPIVPTETDWRPKCLGPMDLALQRRHTK